MKKTKYYIIEHDRYVEVVDQDGNHVNSFWTFYDAYANYLIEK
jgi:hypothetical protein